MRILILSSILIFFIGKNANAQTPLSLAEAIEIGLKNNFQIQISEQQIDIAKRNNTWQNTGRYPTINLQGSLNNGWNGQNNPTGFLNKFNSINAGLSGGIDVGWTLFDGYKVNINKKRLEQLEQQSQVSAKATVENAIQQIILAYYNALIQREQISVLQEVLALSYDRIEYQEIRKEFGQAGTFDVLQTNDAYLNDSTNLLVQQNTYEVALNNLKLAMGEEFSKDYRLSDALEYVAQTYNLEDLQEKMFSNNRNLQNLFVNRELAKIETDFQQSNKYPRIGVNGGGNLGVTPSFLNIKEAQFPIEEGWNTTTNYGLYLNLSASYNLYDAGTRQRNIDNAKVQEMITQLSIEDLKRNLTGQLQNTLTNYNNQVQLLQLTETLIENAKQNLSISEQRFKAGQINSFDYRSIQLAYINASQSKLRAIFNLKNTETELVRLIGGLVE